MQRRKVLKGIGGFSLALPLLEGLQPRQAKAGGEVFPPYAIFIRQANGVAAEQTTELGEEPERFWPTQTGALSEATVAGRALDELTDHLSRMLVVGNVNMSYHEYGDGHANGAMQGLTGRGPVVPNVGGDSEASGMSLDHYIGAQLNPDGRDSLFLYAGNPGGWLGGPCISYRDSNNRRAALHNPVTAYQTIMGVDEQQFAELAARQMSVNDLVRGEMNDLLASPQLSALDRQRLELHLEAIRDLEAGLSCNLSEKEEAALDGASVGYDSDDGTMVLSAARTHLDIAILAVACGFTRSVALQIGSGNDGSTRYANLEDGSLMENYHYISHRRLSHDSSGAIIPNADLLHHYVDRQFAQLFKYLLDGLAAVILPTGEPLIDAGVACWYNDNGNGPGHAAMNVPYVLAGSAGGLLRTGEYIQVAGGEGNHTQMLNTLGTAAGVRKEDGSYLDDFGDPAAPKGVLTELFA